MVRGHKVGHFLSEESRVGDAVNEAVCLVAPLAALIFHIHEGSGRQRPKVFRPDLAAEFPGAFMVTNWQLRQVSPYSVPRCVKVDFTRSSVASALVSNFAIGFSISLLIESVMSAADALT